MTWITLNLSKCLAFNSENTANKYSRAFLAGCFDIQIHSNYYFVIKFLIKLNIIIGRVLCLYGTLMKTKLESQFTWEIIGLKLLKSAILFLTVYEKTIIFGWFKL